VRALLARLSAKMLSETSACAQFDAVCNMLDKARDAGDRTRQDDDTYAATLQDGFYVALENMYSAVADTPAALRHVVGAFLDASADPSVSTLEVPVVRLFYALLGAERGDTEYAAVFAACVRTNELLAKRQRAALPADKRLDPAAADAAEARLVARLLARLVIETK